VASWQCFNRSPRSLYKPGTEETCSNTSRGPASLRSFAVTELSPHTHGTVYKDDDNIVKFMLAEHSVAWKALNISTFQVIKIWTAFQQLSYIYCRVGLHTSWPTEMCGSGPWSAEYLESAKKLRIFRIDVASIIISDCRSLLESPRYTTCEFAAVECRRFAIGILMICFIVSEILLLLLLIAELSIAWKVLNLSTFQLIDIWLGFFRITESPASCAELYNYVIRTYFIRLKRIGVTRFLSQYIKRIPFEHDRKTI